MTNGHVFVLYNTRTVFGVIFTVIQRLFLSHLSDLTHAHSQAHAIHTAASIKCSYVVRGIQFQIISTCGASPRYSTSPSAFADACGAPSSKLADVDLEVSSEAEARSCRLALALHAGC